MNLKEALVEIYKVADNKFNFESVPKLILKQDQTNADNMLGKTAY